MGRCIAIVSDLIFATRIRGTAEKAGVRCEIVTRPNALQDALELDEPRTVFVDMHCEGISPGEAIRTVKSKCPKVRVVAFFSHVQTELMEQARAAGADDVWPRSVFVQRLVQVLEVTARPGPP